MQDLARHPGWVLLTSLVRDEQNRRAQALATRLMRRDEEPPSLETLQYERGFFAGMKFLLRKPSGRDDLQRALEGK